jgi:CelD/BcsL family acetyltransferase involved in cellulose biosynthesis
MLLIGHALEAAIAEGITAADFLRGREGYKYLWGAADSSTFRRVLVPPP